ncbi:hypothetical protein BKA62DRAFT_699137 [Auriculariales sp. MPI-PUGE-AT-0066]|nr:hypothetical protein BKA62DRAFT_699137 [Auriculariales sp. MPI-PUGE-AT-0066]
MLRPLFLLFAAPILVAAAALAPRVSNIPTDYYSLSYTCPTTLGTVALGSTQYVLASNYIVCEYGGNRCSWSMVLPACGIRCPNQRIDGATLSSASYQSSTVIRCLYTGLIFCQYNADGSILAGDSNCVPSWNSCNGPFKRRYRGDDNYTAWLKKRDAHASHAAAAEPVPS